MDDLFYDIKIPRRRDEQPCPDDLTIHFAFLPERSVLRLDLHSDGLPLEYNGKGRILLPNGLCRVPQLTTLDPFLTDRRFIPSKFFKIFFRVQLPKLQASPYTVTCALEMAADPAVRITVNSSDAQNPTCTIAWNADHKLLRFLDGFEEYTVSGDRCYPGPKSIITAVAHLSDGVHPLTDTELAKFRTFYRDAPYLFHVEKGVFTPAPLQPIKRPESRPKNPEIVQQTFDAFRDFSLSFLDRPSDAPLTTASRTIPPPPPKEIAMDGPALLSFSHSANVRAENGKFAFFIIEAKRFSEYKAENAEFVPFVCYWPVYSKMSREQRAWYFYWREEFRHGNALKTDLSYIFVHIYELINRAYGTPEENLDTLFALWRAYRAAFSRLDYYMPIYCADFMILNGLTSRLPSIAAEFPLEVGSMRPFAELYLNEALRDGLHKLPFALLCDISSYKIRQSRFYQQNEALCRETILRVLEEIDRAVRTTKQMPLLSTFNPAPVNASWTAYSGAVCGRAAARLIRARYIPYSADPALREFVAAVMKHTENALRKREKYAGRLRGYTLSDSVTRLIDRLVGASGAAKKTAAQPEAALPPKPIEIDLDAAKALETASWENTKKLIDAVENAQSELDDAPDFVLEFREPEPEPTSAPALSDESTADYADVYGAFAANLSAFQRKFLAAILDGQDYAALSALAAEEFAFPEAIFEQLNDLAQTHIGDIILPPEGGEIYEEHQSALIRALEAI